MAIKTAVYDLKSFPDVYVPSEDTFLLLDALEDDLDFIKKRNPLLCAEIGSGSGVIAASMSRVLNNSFIFSTDINFNACRASLFTSNLNKVITDSCCTSFITGFKSHLFDLLIFNPPYVLTESNETCGTGLSRSWAGGKNGRVVIDELLPLVPDFLTKNGIFYLLLLKENYPEEVINIMTKYNFNYKIVKERKILGEYLYVLKFFF